MKYSLNWLKRYLPDLTASPDELAEVLPLIGHEVESVVKQGLPPSDTLVVGEVLSREPHPNADKLGVCSVKVDAGEPRQIVCGASNYQVGDRVPVALPGAVLPGDFEIKQSKLRGVESAGMMCSAKELGLGEDHEGLMILSERPEVGTPMHELVTEDVIFEVELTANRGDCLSHVGMARELAAYYGVALRVPEAPAPASGEGESLLSGVEVTTPDCPLYTAWSIRGVEVGESPKWLKDALTAVGLRPINNVVDATNYFLFETGQPVHAFDAKKIRGGKLVVRPAAEGETITTLDEKQRTLAGHMMVIADTERPLVIAGVMGSLDAEVDETTTDIVLEIAWFVPGSIRKTTRKLNLFTDSSHRYTRDVDPQGVHALAPRCIDLIRQVAGGEVSGPCHSHGEPPRGDRSIRISGDYVRSVCGYEVKDVSITKMFQRLGFGVSPQQNGGEWNVLVPSFRPEVDRPIDLVEEFVRLHGTAKIPESPVITVGFHRDDAPVAIAQGNMSEFLASRGFHECIHYSLTDEKTLRRFGFAAEPLRLDNPLTSDFSHLRASIVPSLLQAMRVNRHNGNPTERLFETGHVFFDQNGKIVERVAVAFLMSVDPAQGEWHPRATPDFFAAKGLIEDLAQIVGAEITSIASAEEDGWQENQHAVIRGHSLHGRIGLVDVAVAKELDLDGLFLAGELVLAPGIFEREQPPVRFQSFSSFPPTERDLALLVSTGEPAEKARQLIERSANEAVAETFAIESVRPFDVYEGSGLPDGKKSIAYKIRFRAPDRTLKDKEVNTAFDKVQKALKEAGYEIRS